MAASDALNKTPQEQPRYKRPRPLGRSEVGGEMAEKGTDGARIGAWEVPDGSGGGDRCEDLGCNRVDMKTGKINSCILKLLLWTPGYPALPCFRKESILVLKGGI